MYAVSNLEKRDFTVYNSQQICDWVAFNHGQKEMKTAKIYPFSHMNIKTTSSAVDVSSFDKETL